MNHEQLFHYLDESTINISGMSAKEMRVTVDRIIKETRTALDEYMLVDTQFRCFIENIRLLMYLRKYSAQSLSVAARMNQFYIGRLFRDELNRKISAETIRKIANALAIKPSILLKEDIKTAFERVVEGMRAQ